MPNRLSNGFEIRYTLSDVIAAPKVGQEVGDYRLEEQLGEGGMGVVYQARHTVLGKKAAVKLMRPQLCTDRESVRRFFNEAVLTASIRHPGIVEIYDYGVHKSGSAFIAMALLEGETLEARLRTQGALAVLEALRICRQIASALAAAHDAGVVHRDLKPENVFLTEDSDVPGGERIQLLDFGIAKLLGDEDSSAALTRTGTVLGTPLYMSPEQCRGRSDLDGQTDLYALGCMVYQMLSGRPPFSGESALEVGAAHVRDTPVRVGSLCNGLAPEIGALVHHLLAKTPEERPDGATEVADRVDALIATIETTPLGGRNRIATTLGPLVAKTESIELAETVGIGATAGDDPAVDSPPRGRSRLRLVFFSAAALVLVGAIAFALLASRSDQQGSLAPSLLYQPGCEVDPDTCRKFADTLRRGDGVAPDHDYARRLLDDACRQGASDACLDNYYFEERADIPLSRIPDLGVRSADIDIVVAVDFATEDFNRWVDRYAELEIQNHGNYRVHFVSIADTPASRSLTLLACALSAQQAFGDFLPKRGALVRGGLKTLREGELLPLVGNDDELSQRHLEICRRELRRRRIAIRHHGLTKSGTVFVAGKRLEPPYADKAVKLLASEAQALREDNTGRRKLSDRVPSTRGRYNVETTSDAERPIQLISYCDPASVMCQASKIIITQLPQAFGDVIATDIRHTGESNDNERTAAACALGELGLRDALMMAQIGAPTLDGTREWLSPTSMKKLSAEVTEERWKELTENCPKSVATNTEALASLGLRAPIFFVNGRPAEIGKVSGIRNLVVQELELAELLKVPTKQARKQLMSYDTRFRPPVIEPPENLR